MELKFKKLDLIKIIDKKNKIINKNFKIIENLFISELYKNFILCQKNINNPIKNINDNKNTFQYPKNSKLFEKLILDKIIKNVPQNLLQYFSQYEIKKYVHQIIESNKEKFKINNLNQKNKIQIYSRNKSCDPRKINKYKIINDIKKDNYDEKHNNNNNIEFEIEKNLLEKKLNKKINQKKYIISKATRKNSEKLYNHMNINENNKDLNEYNNISNLNNPTYFTVNTKHSRYRDYLLNTYNLLDNNSENEINIKKNSYLNNLNNLSNNIENKNKLNNISDINYTEKSNKRKIFLNICQRNEKPKKKYSKLILDKNITFKESYPFKLSIKDKKKGSLLNSFSPDEININDKSENILTNLKKIKKRFKTQINKKNNNKNIKFMKNIIENKKNLDLKFIKSEVKKRNNYEYFMNNKKQIERKNITFKTLRNTFNISEKSKGYKNQNTFIKTVNNFYNEEKKFDFIINQIYKENYMLRLNKNKKNSKNIREKLIKINEKHGKVNHLMATITRLFYDNK